MYYVFRTPDGRPRVSHTIDEPNLTSIPLELVETTEEDPKFTGNEIWINGEWEVIEPCPPYRKLRADSYPPIEDQLDDLWRAMDEGLLPKAGRFYDRIKDVKDKYAKTEQQVTPPYTSRPIELKPDE